MHPQIATIVYAAAILGLFMLDRDRQARFSKALWIPVVWLLINGSRPVSQWLQVGPTMDSPDAYLNGSPLDALVFTILLAVGFFVLVRRKRRVGKILRANLPIVLFFSYGLLSTLWSDYTFVAFKRWIKAVGDLVMVLVVLTDPDPLAAIKRFLAGAGFVLVPLSVLLIKYYPDLGRSYNIWTWLPTYGGVTTNKNELGMTCLFVGLASLWRLLTAFRDEKGKERMRRLIAHGTIVASVIWLLWTADSMTSLSCFILGSGLITITMLIRFARRPLVVHLLVAAVVCVSFSVLFLDVGGGALQTMGRDPTLTGRTAIWKIVLGLVRSPLFGTGFQSFWLGNRLQQVWDNFGLHIEEAHNGYLEIYLNLGVIGVVLLAVLIVTGYRNVILAFTCAPGVASLWLAYFVAAVAYNFTESAFGGAAIWITFLLAIVVVPKAAKFRKVRLHSRSIATDSFSESGPQVDQIFTLQA